MGGHIRDLCTRHSDGTLLTNRRNVQQVIQITGVSSLSRTSWFTSGLSNQQFCGHPDPLTDENIYAAESGGHPKAAKWVLISCKRRRTSGTPSRHRRPLDPKTMFVSLVSSSRKAPIWGITRQWVLGSTRTIRVPPLVILNLPCPKSPPASVDQETVSRLPLGDGGHNPIIIRNSIIFSARGEARTAVNYRRRAVNHFVERMI